MNIEDLLKKMNLTKYRLSIESGEVEVPKVVG